MDTGDAGDKRVKLFSKVMVEESGKVEKVGEEVANVRDGTVMVEK